MNPFTQTCLDVFSPLNINLAKAADEVDTAVQEALKHLSVTEDISGYRREFPLHDATESDYCNKLIGPGGPGEIMTSLRFQNDNVDQPYIEIRYSTFAPGIDETMFAIRDAIRRAYHTSAPAFISFFVAGRLQNTAAFPVTPAKGLYAASLTQSAIALRHDQVSICKAVNTGFYGRYLAEYTAFNKTSPRNRLVSQPEDFDYLTELVANGTLFEITIGGAWAGVIAYDYLPALSVPGFEIVEEFLIGAFRGKGYAKYAQSMLIEQMRMNNHQDAQLMFGTIHTENIASIGTAGRNGRMLLGTWYEMPFD
jgi:hypothetical protein